MHPFLLAIFPILSLYSHNVYETQVDAVGWPIAATLGTTFVVWLLLRVASRDPWKAGLATSLVAGLFFGFKWIRPVIDPVWTFLKSFWVYSGETRASPMAVLVLLAIVIGVGFLIIFRWAGSPWKLTRYLNVFAVILVAMPTVGIATARLGGHPTKVAETPLPATSSRGWTPDIYCIVLDGYARGDVMANLFGFDNSAFRKHLQDRGFFVAKGATSNYCQTRLSLASTLNLDYLDKIVDPANPDLLPLSEAIKDNLATRLLRPLGYKTVAFSTGFEPTDLLGADYYFSPRPGSQEFSQILVEMTPLEPWLSEVKHEDRYSALRDRTLYLLDRLPTVAGIKEPTFTLAHLLIPHPPFVFDESGADVSPRVLLPHGQVVKPLDKSFGSPDYFREAYRKQAAFITSRVQRAVDQILASSPKPPVIVVMSDHGSWLRYHPDDVEATDVLERFGIICTVYAGGRQIQGIGDGMTSVNLFRALLREIAGADLPPLPDRNFFSDYHDPLHFKDVTDRVHSEAERTRTFQYPPKYPGLQQQF